VRKIIVHLSLDIDAAASAWASKRFAPGFVDALVVFKPSDWDGADMGQEDLAVDMDAGGKGIKGERRDGVIHSALATIVERYASPDDQQALRHLVRFIDAQDAFGSAVHHLAPEINEDAAETLSLMGVNSVFRALQSFHRDDAMVLERMFEIFDGMLSTGRARMRAEREADAAEIRSNPSDHHTNTRVAIVREGREYGTSFVLFRRGVRAVIYIEGMNIGVVSRDPKGFRADHPLIRAAVKQYDTTGKWFFHTSGFLACCGSRKAPAQVRTEVLDHQEEFISSVLEAVAQSNAAAA